MKNVLVTLKNKNVIIKLALFIVVCMTVMGLLLLKSENINPVQEESNSVVRLDKNNGKLVQNYVSQSKVVDGYVLHIADFSLKENSSITLLLKDKDDNKLDEYIGKATLSSENIEKNNINYFCFNDKKISLGNRYYLYILLEGNIEQNEYVNLTYNENFGNLRVEEYNQNGFLVLYEVGKSMKYYLVAALIILLVMLASSGLSVCLNKKIYKVIPLVFMFYTFILYLCGIFGNLLLGVYINIILSFVSFGLFVWKVDFEKKETYKNVFNTSTLVLTIVAFFLFVINKYRIPLEWDEFSHWELVVRNMFSLDKMQICPESTVYALRYPPAMSLLQYFGMNICGRFIAGISFSIYQFVSISFIYAILEISLFKKEIVNIFYKIAIICLSILVVYANFFRSTYIDCFLGIALCFVMTIYFSREKLGKYEFISILLGLFMLILTKEMGFFIAGMVVVVMIVDTIIKKIPKKDKAIFSLSILGSSGFAYISWQLFCKLNIAQTTETSGDMVSASGLCIDVLTNLFNEENRVKTYSIIKNFFTKILQQSVSDNGIKYSYSIWMLIGIVVIYCISSRILKDKDKKRYIFGWSFVGIGYAVLLLLAYMFTIKSESLPSIGRYLGSFTVAFLIFTVVVLTKTKNKNLGMILILVMFVVANKTYIPQDIVTSFLGETREETNDALVIEKYENVNNFISNEDKVWYISQGNDGISYWKFRYAMTPGHVQDYKAKTIGQYNWWISPVGLDSTIPYVISEKDFALELMDYDYVYIGRADDNFINNYCHLFVSNITDNTLYKVVVQNNGVILIRYMEF